ncbi:bacterial transcriptional activator domain-containing protein [Streptomyces europaeiscabiei]|uniref:Bacterial transcriptional activator domain-containing protein n=3 Tax=Streptomyces europaeiscabiei TaxID=146819 RepID=A0ABU4NJ76_9ACTN|nr:bacterial transcriptional activator domain-containing protein [Streptomyces europaeiscabiei]MDX3545824.1 bacterial transcriptional activator domain-containing protein [Streptomyces europaeiscabiei]MDX3555513.1 bacterial transcriptional activator domain-containing protein [Streptomyces europaeiscabiei]MDX3703173.1 bacterial transcriptional activator domain-containing protein [Streptomyces europaeiscabiei]MDX3710978.1 bacterial transcriptional activator domain-containing protein [Streptomyces 
MASRKPARHGLSADPHKGDMAHPPFPDASLFSRTERFLAEAAADPALQLHQYGDTVRLREQATAIDPLREVAWRVRMRAANALGDDDGVLTAVQGCETALPQIDATPSPRTRKLAQAATAAAPCSAVGAAARRTWDPTCGQCQPGLAQPVSGRRPAPPAERGAFGSGWPTPAASRRGSAAVRCL